MKNMKPLERNASGTIAGVMIERKLPVKTSKNCHILNQNSQLCVFIYLGVVVF